MTVLLKGTIRDPVISTAFLGIVLSSLSHLLSVLLRYSLSTAIFCWGPRSKSTLPVAVAALHIVNPAGVFLLSPYPEALFSFLSLLGLQLYLGALRHDCQGRRLRAETDLLAAGLVFGFASTVRSNGVLNGALFLYDAILTTFSIGKGKFSTKDVRRLIIICTGGCFIALGTIIPQYGAYIRYCNVNGDYEKRPWCNNAVPSIYAWVQSYYW